MAAVRVAARAPSTVGGGAAGGRRRLTKLTGRRCLRRVPTAADRWWWPAWPRNTRKTSGWCGPSCGASTSRLATAPTVVGACRVATGCRPPMRWERPACSWVQKPSPWSCGCTRTWGRRWPRSRTCWRPNSVSPSRPAASRMCFTERLGKPRRVTPRCAGRCGAARWSHQTRRAGASVPSATGCGPSRIQRRGHRPRTRLRRRARARRVGAVSPLQPRPPPDVSGPVVQRQLLLPLALPHLGMLPTVLRKIVLRLQPGSAGMCRPTTA